MIKAAPTIMDRIEANVELIPFSTCWFWLGAISSKTLRFPHPVIKLQGKTQLVRRVVYEHELGGELDTQDRIIVTCGEYLCVNPNHLELV